MPRITNPLDPHVDVAPPSAAPAPQATAPDLLSLRWAGVEEPLDGAGRVVLRVGGGPGGPGASVERVMVPRDTFADALAGAAPLAPMRAGARPDASAPVFEPRHQQALAAVAVGCLLGALLVGLHSPRLAALVAPSAFAAALLLPWARGEASDAQLGLVLAAAATGAPTVAASAYRAELGTAAVAYALMTQLAAAMGARAIVDGVAPRTREQLPQVPALAFSPPLEVRYTPAAAPDSTDAKVPSANASRWGGLAKFAPLASGAVVRVAEVRLTDPARGTLGLRGTVDAAFWGAARSTLPLDGRLLQAALRLAQPHWLAAAPRAAGGAPQQPATIADRLQAAFTRLADAMGNAPLQAKLSQLQALRLLLGHKEGAARLLEPAALHRLVEGGLRAAVAPSASAAAPGPALVQAADALPAVASAAADATAAAASSADLLARAGFNVLLDRSRLSVDLALNPGVHTVAGLGLEAGFAPLGNLRVRVAPGTRAHVATEGVDQALRPEARPAAWFARLGASLGAFLAAAWRFVVVVASYLLGRGAAGTGDATPASPRAAVDTEVTRRGGQLFAHGLRVRTNAPLDVRLGNFTRHFASVSLHGANVDEAGGVKPLGSVRLFGVPVLPLHSNWVRNLLLRCGVRLTTDPYRLLYEGDAFAAPLADAPALAAVDLQEQAARAAAAKALMGALLGPIEVPVARDALMGPRATLAQPIGDASYELRLFATPQDYRVGYDLRGFEEPLSLTVDGLQLAADVRRTDADGQVHRGPRLQLNAPQLVARGFWPHSLAAGTEWSSVAAPRLVVAEGAGAFTRALVSLTDVSVARDAAGGRVQFRLGLPEIGTDALLQGLASLGGPINDPCLRLLVRGRPELVVDQYFAALGTGTAFVPGPPRATPVVQAIDHAALAASGGPLPTATWTPAAAGAGDVDDLDGTTLVGTPVPSPARSRASSVQGTPSGASSVYGDADTLVGTASVGTAGRRRRSSAGAQDSASTLVGEEAKL